MKRIICAALALTLMTSCAKSGKGFSPRLDTNSSASVSVVGSYNNFESLEAAFDRFKEYYPNVDLSYTRIDDYNNMIGTVLDGTVPPDIYTAYSWMNGRAQYQAVFDHAEDLSDSSLGLDLDCIRPGLLTTNENGLPMVPVFSTTYGMLVNNDIFKKEGLKVPQTFTDMASVCAALSEKGYKSPVMGYSGQDNNFFAFSLSYPLFAGSIADDPDTIAKLNSLDPSAGEAMRPAIEAAVKFTETAHIDMAECAKMEDSYEAVMLRFFEGDVPMMICSGDTVSGTKKRESKSEKFTASPFTYSFTPIPLTDEGGYFLDSPSLQFAVNKNSDELDMTNEFMRFLITSEELNRLAETKRLVTPTKDLSFDSVYAPFGDIPTSRVISPEAVGINDDTVIQYRLAVNKVVGGEMTADEAIGSYGSLE
ncbi:MAG: carbohydrate ABC transporter substrate-binding protein [Oscillospiraceae bacterium]|nr:carbohydrate ABC transporter substrate-binding protein [Oscillospiraceae bacterium]